MLRMLALPIALAAVLASAACASAGGSARPVMASPDASSTLPAAPSTPPAASSTPPTASPTPSDAEPEATEDGTTATGAPSPDAPGSAPAGQDPGVPGLPAQSGASIDDVLRLGAVATWLDPSRLALSLPASSSCWAFAGEPVLEAPARVVVRVEQPQACDAPDAARTYEIAVPDGIDLGADLQLAVVGLGQELTLTLPAR